MRGDRSPATVTGVSTDAETVEAPDAIPEVPPAEASPPDDPAAGEGEAGTAAPPGEVSAEPEGEAPPPSPAGTKLIFACQYCGKQNDLMRPDAMVAEPMAHERYATCPGCKGLGRVDSGSLVAGKGTLPCPDCGGAGYLDLSTPGQPPAEADAPGEPPWPDAVWNAETGTWQ